jgi:hypothetical protein
MIYKCAGNYLKLKKIKINFFDSTHVKWLGENLFITAVYCQVIEKNSNAFRIKNYNSYCSLDIYARKTKNNLSI